MKTSNPDKALYKNLWISLLILVWLTATLMGLWWFQNQNLRPFIEANDDQRYWQAKETEKLLLPILSKFPQPAVNQVTLLSFWNPSCLCNQLSQRHFDGLLNPFNESDLRIITVVPFNTPNDTIEKFKQLNGERMSIVRAPTDFTLPSSPAAAFFNPQNSLGYFGAWGFGALCTISSDDFFASIVRSLQGSGYGPFANVAGNGCFCQWPSGN